MRKNNDKYSLVIPHLLRGLPQRMEMPQQVRHDRSAFTLIELSIVLTIIAIIIGSIVVGRELIRQSQLNAVASEVGQYTQAITDFRDKYHALPGDFTGATALWGTLGAGFQGCSGTATSPLPSTATCDGNGDGRITVQSADDAAHQYEQFLAWKHLVNAGLIDGNFSGIAPNGGDSMQAVISTNVPASKLPGAGYSIISLFSSDFTGNNVTSLSKAHYFTGVNYLHMLQLGAASGGKSTLYPALTVREALSLDTKLDDGLPGSGKVMGPRQDSAYAGNCTTTTSASTAVYDKTQSGIKCSLLFLLGF